MHRVRGAPSSISCAPAQVSNYFQQTLRTMPAIRSRKCCSSHSSSRRSCRPGPNSDLRDRVVDEFGIEQTMELLGADRHLHDARAGTGEHRRRGRRRHRSARHRSGADLRLPGRRLKPGSGRLTLPRFHVHQATQLSAGLRRQYADFNALQTRSAFILSLIDQLTILRLARSMTVAS